MSKGIRPAEQSQSQTLWQKFKPSSFKERVATVAIAALCYYLPAAAFCGAGAYTLWKVEQFRQPYASVLAETPRFNGYKIGRGTPYSGTSLMSLSTRPANLFYNALFGPNAVTPPGGEIFALKQPYYKIRRQIASADPNAIVSFSAKGVPAKIHSSRNRTVSIPDLADLHGGATYRISYGELQETLASQKIYVSPTFPLPFYRALKEALIKDGVATLPGDGKHPVKLSEIELPHCKALIKQAAKNYQRYGFQTKQQCLDVLDLTLYQLGALVVKREDFHIFIDGNGKILERNPGDPDAIRLINACGIRGIHLTQRTHIENDLIMREAFQTALIAAESGLVVFPAVGMGVWKGDPDLYWRAFLDAVAQSNTKIEQIFVNPGHQTTTYGRYRGCSGEEFQKILDEYKICNDRNPQALANLNKIINIFDRKTDVVQLAYHLKKNYPDKTVSLFNASDPDVTLGNHVGEYVNSTRGDCTTTEENYTALGTNGLCFEGVTGVHADPRRIVAVR